jgi:hypothetical protein
MNLVERARNICLRPDAEWSDIEGETTRPGDLFTSYAAPLAAIGAVAGFVGGSIVGRTLPYIGTYRMGIFTGLVEAVYVFVMALVSVAIVAFVINLLAPTFGGQKNGMQAIKLAVYSYTPFWIAGVLQIFPLLAVLAILAGFYGIYVMYLGLPRLMKCPQDKAAGYTALVVVAAIVVAVCVAAASAVVLGIGAMTTGALTGATASRSSDSVQFDKNSPLGKLQALGDKMQESSGKMDQAAKSGDTNAEAQAAMGALGTLLGGGKHVDPIGTDELKKFVPDTFAGLAKTGSSAEKNGIAGLMVSKAEATYGESGKDVTLRVSDTGGVSGMMALANWAGAQEEHENQDEAERTYKQGGRLVHEKQSKTGGTNEYSIVLGDRFLVEAEGNGVDLNTLKAAVGGLDLGRLEGMKDVGVQK